LQKGLAKENLGGSVVNKLSRLAELRRRRLLTQMELAKLSGVSRAAIATLEKGHRTAQPGTARKLAKVLKVKPEELV
jgi:DNA-binding XRE family transcriptional regulator